MSKFSARMFVLAVLCFPALAPAQAPCRIGVFDSRAVAIAWAQSKNGPTAQFRQFRADYDQAKQEKDEKLMKELEQQAEWAQIRLHQMAFSTGPVGDLLAIVKDKLPGIARQERVLAIVSKWECPYTDPKVELVDVTLALAKLFDASDDVAKTIEDMKTQPPVPFAELPLDPRM